MLKVPVCSLLTSGMPEVDAPAQWGIKVTSLLRLALRVEQPEAMLTSCTVPQPASWVVYFLNTFFK